MPPDDCGRRKGPARRVSSERLKRKSCGGSGILLLILALGLNGDVSE